MDTLQPYKTTLCKDYTLRLPVRRVGSWPRRPVVSMARVNTFGQAVKGFLGRYSRHGGSPSITLGTFSSVIASIASIAAGMQQLQEAPLTCPASPANL